MKNKSIFDHLKNWQPIVLILVAIGGTFTSVILFVSSYGQRLSVLESQQTLEMHAINDLKSNYRQSFGDLKEMFERRNGEQDQAYFRFQDHTLQWLRNLNDKVDKVCKTTKKED